jgi:hypothetical protein
LGAPAEFFAHFVHQRDGVLEERHLPLQRIEEAVRAAALSGSDRTSRLSAIA